VNYAFDSTGDVFFIASKLAEHTANLEKNPKGSLLVSEEQVGLTEGTGSMIVSTQAENVLR